MPHYVVNVKFTPEGLAEIRNTTARAGQFKANAEKAGVKVLGQYWTEGQFDGLLILEGSSELSVTAVVLRLGSLGYVRTEMVRAFERHEMDQIIENMTS